MKVLVEGYAEVEPVQGTDTHLMHLMRGDGKKACRCRYGKGRSAAVAEPKTVHVELQQVQRNESGYLYVEKAEEFLFLHVTLCEKSERALRNELNKWQKWEGKE